MAGMCGVFGGFAPDLPVAHLTYLGLYALQHRGQESAGMAVADGATLTVVKDMGLASETPALDIVGAELVRELEPGEIVAIDGDGPRTVRVVPAEDMDPRLCLFEFVYFARPDAQLYGSNVAAARTRMGELLAEQAPLAPDTVVPERPAL